MRLTRKEISIFREIVLHNPDNSLDLAEKAHTSQSYLSTTLNKLREKGLIQVTRNAKNRTPHPDNTPHATILRNIILSNPQSNIDYLANNGIRILASTICQNIRTLEELSGVSGVSPRSLWTYMNKARSLGLLITHGTISINPRFTDVSQFVQAYTRYINETNAREHAEDALIKWSCGGKYLFESKHQLSLQRTGISAFRDFGALFLTLKTLYTNSTKGLGLEDHLINHMLSEGTGNVLPLLITWRLNESKIDMDYLHDTAFKYRVDTITEIIQAYLDTDGKEKQDYLINWDEFNDKYREYQQ